MVLLVLPFSFKVSLLVVGRLRHGPIRNRMAFRQSIVYPVLTGSVNIE
jgi:hypothetical protein